MHELLVLNRICTTKFNDIPCHSNHLSRLEATTINKKIMLIAVVIILIGGVLLGLLLLNGNSNLDVEEFKLSDYQSFINNFPSDKTVDMIHDVTDAKIQAEKVWVEYYSESVKGEKPYTVSYDSANKVWLVTGTLPTDYMGGVPYILIQTDGIVLAVWHTK